MILKQGHTYRAMPHDGKVIRRIYRGGRCYYKYSPYSPEATQALKAAFPQYWTAIRNYGVTHPQLVPFVNEDPMLIVSLVEVGKERWLVGDGKAYIDTGFIAEGGMHAIVNIKPVANVMWNIGSHNTMAQGNVNHYNRNEIRLYDSTDVTVNVLNMGTNNKNGTLYPNQSNILEMVSYGNPYYIVNGTRYDIAGVSGVLHPLNSVRIFYAYYNDMPYGNNVGLAYTELRDCDDQPIREMYPFTRNGENGMLDILSGTFHPNANTQGAFTIEITDKA